VGLVEVGLAAGALRGEGDGFVDGEGEDGSGEEVSGFDGSSIGMLEDFEAFFEIDRRFESLGSGPSRGEEQASLSSPFRPIDDDERDALRAHV
jgi:hypothetical protein